MEFRSTKLDGVSNCAECRAAVREEEKTKRRERYRKVKRSAIEAYGGRCWGCGETREELLTLERVFGRHNRKVYREDERKADMRDLLYLLKKQKFPKDRYRVSCAGCKGKFRDE